MKTCNLLYYKKIGDNFIPNGHEIYTDTHIMYHDGMGYMSTHIRDSYDKELTEWFEMNYCHIDDFDDSITSFYIVDHPNVNYNQFGEDKFKIPDKLKSVILKHKNVFLTFLFEHESFPQEDFEIVINKLKLEGIPLSQVILISNNDKVYDLQKIYNVPELKVHKTNFLFYSFTKTLLDIKCDFKPNKDGKFFISRNRNPKKHRLGFLFYLIKENLLNEINLSFVPTFFVPPNDTIPYTYLFDENYIKENMDIIEWISNFRKQDDYEIEKNYINSETLEFQHHSDFSNLNHIPEYGKSFENSYINIVTESFYFENNSIHITEKTLRPFYFYQIPIFVSTPEHIKYLKKWYNFDLFEDVIDHSYDLEFDNKKRMEMIIKEIKRINDNKEFFIKFYKNNQHRFEYNREEYKKTGLSCRKHDIDFFLNLM